MVLTGYISKKQVIAEMLYLQTLQEVLQIIRLLFLVYFKDVFLYSYSMKAFLLVFLGSGIGGVLRYASGRIIQHYSHSSFPLGTLIVNIVAGLLIGIFVGLAGQKQWFSESMRWLLIAGFCGGFSTFSTFSHESVQLWQTGQYFFFSLYIFLSVVLCIAATAAGLWCFKA